MNAPLLCHWKSAEKLEFPDWCSATVAGFPENCSVKIKSLSGGLSQGMRVIDICTGPMTVRILPERGMGIWRAWDQQNTLGWESPIKNGPVHPALVNQERRGGLGWLDGFDELLCRCGLASLGPPGKEEGGLPFTLHGRIANLPAWELEFGVDRGEMKIWIRGSVDECVLFDHQFRLTSTYVFTPGSRRIEIIDRVTNLSAKTDHFQLLYHLNVGRPILGHGARVVAPVRELSPQTPRAGEGIDHWNQYGGPEQGFAEQVYLMHLHGDQQNNSLAVLHSADEKSGVLVRFPLDSLPCFTVWKNTGAIAEGYVTGLEPATSFPNFRGFERQSSRLEPLPPDASWEAHWSVQWLGEPQEVKKACQEVESLAAQRPTPIIHRFPHASFTPQSVP